MRPSGDALANAVTGSYRLATRADVLFDREVIYQGVTITSGDVIYDRTAARLARATVNVADPLRVPVAPDDILTPFGYELQLWRGVADPSGDDMASLGVFPIQSSSVDGVSFLSNISTEDRSRLVSDARFEDDYQIAAGTNYATAIEDLIDDGVSDLEYLFPSTTYTTPTLTFAAQSDRWEAAQQMAKAIGNELLFDGFGRVVMRPEPTFDDEAVATVAEGSNLLGMTVALDRSTAYNRVIAAGRNASNDDQYRGVATDDDPESPTYYDGPFGRKPRFFYSEFIASDAQAESAAAAILAANLGVAYSVDFSMLPDPRLECSDVVLMQRSALGVDAFHIIDSLSIGLAADAPMHGLTRTRQEAS